MKIIKRYSNRRLYDTEASKTITLDQVAELIQLGENITVIDNISGKNITSKVLGQTLLKLNEPESNEPLINFVLTTIIRESENGLLEIVKKLVYAGIGIAQMPTQDRESLFDALVKVSDTYQEHDNVIENITQEGKKITDEVIDSVKESIENISNELNNVLLFMLDTEERKEKINNLMNQVNIFSNDLLNLKEN